MKSIEEEEAEKTWKCLVRINCLEPFVTIVGDLRSSRCKKRSIAAPCGRPCGAYAPQRLGWKKIFEKRWELDWVKVRKWEKTCFDFSAGNFGIGFLLFLFHFCLYNKSSLYNFLYWFFLVFHICLMISNDWSLPDVISLEKQCAQMSLITFSIADRLCGPKSLLHLVQYWDCQKRRFMV